MPVLKSMSIPCMLHSPQILHHCIIVDNLVLSLSCILYLLIFFSLFSYRISSWTTEGKVSKAEDTTIGASEGNRWIEKLHQHLEFSFIIFLHCNLSNSLDHQVKLLG